MTVGPLQRMTGAIGLLALLPTAVMWGQGNLSARDTAVRAAVTLLLTVLVGRFARWYLTATAGTFERQVSEPVPAPVEAPRRRRSDPETTADTVEV